MKWPVPGIWKQSQAVYQALSEKEEEEGEPHQELQAALGEPTSREGSCFCLWHLAGSSRWDVE